MDPALPQATSWQFYLTPHAAWDAMYEDCAKATSSIEFEQYILENDRLGKRFLELFIQKAIQGVRIFLICDTFGSAALHNQPQIQQLQASGAAVYFYHPIRFWNMFMPWTWFPRTHMKTLLIDNQVAYTGGVCLAERMQDWRDTHIRITGPVIAEVRSAFDEIETLVKGGHLKRLLRNWRKSWRKPDKNDHFHYLTNRPRWRRYSIYQELVHAVKHAKSRIYITTAFFIPNHHFIELLRQAHERGVDVEVIVPLHSDVLLADWLCLSYYGQLFAAGVRIFRYQETVLHCKTALIDDRWATVGSMNMDVISFFHNREANLVITEPAALAALENHFAEDLKSSIELTWEEWRREPLWKKLAGYSARLIKMFF